MALRKYPQVDHIEHVHTAGNSSGIVDGAALVLVGSAKRASTQPHTTRPNCLAALVGTEPTIMLIGPAPASQKALQMAGMTIDDIDLIECNEAFAAVPLRFMREMGLIRPKRSTSTAAQLPWDIRWERPERCCSVPPSMNWSAVTKRLR